jgi:asparagine synthase (glutamine-hydrolysing)
MCGIAGFVDLRNRESVAALRATARLMGGTLAHRGPDDSGEWADADAGVALGHRRLSVVDLSPHGHQPMVSACGRYVIVFNGEIYNYRDVRGELDRLHSAATALTVEADGPTDADGATAKGRLAWRGHCDTEVMLAAIAQFGLVEAIKRFVGMFAFALWDRQGRELHMVRDRLGEKPLYYGWMGGVLLFWSELKALRAHPAWRGEIDRGSLALFARHNYVPAPYSIYRDVRKVCPGTIVSVRLASRSPREAVTTTYWSARDTAERGVAGPFRGTRDEAVKELDALLRQAVAQQMVADVPLGAFLSGGVDSSTVVALMQSQSARPVKTFTIGYGEADFNEAGFAKAVARHIGTEHTELYVTAAQAMAVIPELPMLYDEPFADSSQIPTYLLSGLTRRHVTVSLSGDGGDELFGGYNRYLWGRTIARTPRPVRVAAAACIRSLSPETWERAIGAASSLVSRRFSLNRPGEKLHKLAEILTAQEPAIYSHLVSHWKEPEALVLGSSEPVTALSDRGRWADLSNFSQQMMYLDMVNYLPDDILVKVDRAAMGVSLESRVPLLDHRVVEFAWRIPLSMKIRSGKGKWLLRQVLHRYVPAALVERPKMGFSLPIGAWLRGPLRDWAENLLDPQRIAREGFFNPEPVRQKWRQHLSGERAWHYYLWDILMFQAWLEHSEAREQLIGPCFYEAPRTATASGPSDAGFGRADASSQAVLPAAREPVFANGLRAVKVLLFANTDWYLYNFRLPLAQALRDSGANVVLVSPPGPYGPRLLEHGFRWIAVPMRRRSLNPVREAGLIVRLVLLYRAERPDLAHHFTLKCLVYGSLAARAAGIAGCVNAVAGMGYVFSSRSAGARLLRPVLESVLRRLMLRNGGRMRLILQNFDDRAVFLRQRLARPEDIRVIRGSGVDTARFHPPVDTPPRTVASFRALLATRLLWDKGVGEFVEAARLLKASGVAAEFLIAGSPDAGNPAAVPAATIAGWEREGVIKALGHVEPMDGLLREVDLVVLPTTYGEGVPRILLEAAASGLAIVATDVPGCREIVEHDVNGLLVTPGNTVALANAIERLAADPDERLRFGRAGRARALAEFDQRIVIRDTLAVYQELAPVQSMRSEDVDGPTICV